MVERKKKHIAESKESAVSVPVEEIRRETEDFYVIYVENPNVCWVKMFAAWLV